MNPLIVADSWTAQCSQILSAKSDLVIAAVPYREQAVIEILKAGIRFLGLAPHSLNDIYTDIAIIAGAVGETAKGEQVISAMKTDIASVVHRTNSLPRPRVYCEEWGKPLIASQAWVAELVEAAGGAFIGTPGKATTAETILAADPEVVIAAWCGAGDKVPLEKVIESRGWAHMTAARNGRVYCIPDEFLNTPAPIVMRGLHALAAAIHPQEFSDIEPPRSIGTTHS